MWNIKNRFCTHFSSYFSPIYQTLSSLLLQVVQLVSLQHKITGSDWNWMRKFALQFRVCLMSLIHHHVSDANAYCITHFKTKKHRGKYRTKCYGSYVTEENRLFGEKNRVEIILPLVRHFSILTRLYGILFKRTDGIFWFWNG